MLKRKKPIPFDFILEELIETEITVKPMFGCYAIYVGDKIMLILRDKSKAVKQDDGVWLATYAENLDDLQKIFPNLRSIQLFGTPPTAWQILPKTSPDFESSVLKACDMIRNRDPRIGRLVQKKLKTSPKKKKR